MLVNVGHQHGIVPRLLQANVVHFNGQPMYLTPGETINLIGPALDIRFVEDLSPAAIWKNGNLVTINTRAQLLGVVLINGVPIGDGDRLLAQAPSLKQREEAGERAQELLRKVAIATGAELFAAKSDDPIRALSETYMLMPSKVVPSLYFRFPTPDHPFREGYPLHGYYFVDKNNQPYPQWFSGQYDRFSGQYPRHDSQGKYLCVQPGPVDGAYLGLADQMAALALWAASDERRIWQVGYVDGNSYIGSIPCCCSDCRWVARVRA